MSAEVHPGVPARYVASPDRTRIAAGVIAPGLIVAWWTALLDPGLSVAHHRLPLVTVVWAFLVAVAVAALARPAWARHMITGADDVASRTWVPPAMIASGTATLLLVQLRRHWAFETHAFDLVLHEEVVRSLWHGPFMYSHMLGESFLSHHVVPIFMLFSLVYPVWPGPVWLLVLQGLLLGVGGMFVWLLSRSYGLRPAIGMTLVAVFFLYRGTLSGYFRGFQEEVIAIPFLLGLFWAERAGHGLLAALMAGLALACREDVAVSLAVYGVLLAIRPDRRIAGIALSSISVAWLAVTYGWIMPTHSSNGEIAELGRWSRYGTSVAGVAYGLATRPSDVLRSLWNPGVGALLGSLLFLPLLDPMAVVPLVVPVVACTTSTFPTQAGLQDAYAALFVPYLIAGAARALSAPHFQRLLASDRIAIGVCALLLLTNARALPYPWYAPGAREAHRGIAALDHSMDGHRLLVQGSILPHVGWPKDYDVLLSPDANATQGHDVVLLSEEQDPWPLTRQQVRQLTDDLIRAGWLPRSWGSVTMLVRAGRLS